MPLLRIIISFAFSNLTFITIRLFVRDLIQDERVLLYVVVFVHKVVPENTKN